MLNQSPSHVLQRLKLVPDAPDETHRRLSHCTFSFQATTCCPRNNEDTHFVVDDDEQLDQTSDVMDELGEKKFLPNLESLTPPPPNMSAPLPLEEPVSVPPSGQIHQGVAPVPTGGLPPGWTPDQWEHYGWTWLEQQGRA